MSGAGGDDDNDDDDDDRLECRRLVCWVLEVEGKHQQEANNEAVKEEVSGPGWAHSWPVASDTYSRTVTECSTPKRLVANREACCGAKGA